MGALVSISDTLATRICAVNPSISNVVTNSTTETAFDTVYTFPSQAERYQQAPIMVRVRACGLFSTDVLNLGFTLRTRWGGISGTIIQSTGAFTLAASQTDLLWWIQGFLLFTTTGPSASMESQWFTAFDGNATMTSRMKNTSPFTVDTTNEHDVTISAQWTTASANNSIHIRAMIVDIDGP